MGRPWSRGGAVGRRGRAEQPRRVVIVGGSVAGVLAAAAASGGGRSVTVLERDPLPEQPRPRSGVPQGRQPHVFLHRGLLAVEELLPGFRADLRAAGAVPFDTAGLAWLNEFGWAAHGGRHFEVLSATRPLFEHVVRRRALELPGVCLRDGCRVEGIRRGGDGGPPWWVDLADGTAEPADLVIDATGRASRLPAWLVALGVGPVRTSVLDARTGYASRAYALDPRAVRPAGVAVLQTPDSPAGGFVLPVEGGRWLVGAVGSGERRPPRDPGGYQQFLADVRDPAQAQLAGAGRPEGDVAVHRQTGNRRHHYERLRDWPAGLLVIGDAMCAFNPFYGQGITVAACEALVLRRAFEEGKVRPGRERWLLRRFGRVVALPWAIATGEDHRYPSSTGRASPAQVLLGRWARELSRLAAHGEPLAHESMARVYHLMASPWLLLRPALVAAVLRARVRGHGRPTPRPVILDPDP